MTEFSTIFHLYYLRYCIRGYLLHSILSQVRPDIRVRVLRGSFGSFLTPPCPNTVLRPVVERLDSPDMPPIPQRVLSIAEVLRGVALYWKRHLPEVGTCAPAPGTCSYVVVLKGDEIYMGPLKQVL